VSSRFKVQSSRFKEKNMARIERFEEIEAWKKARQLTQEIYEATAQGSFKKDFGLRDQLQRASVSIMANIAEGFDGGSNREFIKFLSYALRSTTEVQSHLYVALDQQYLDQETFLLLYDFSIEVKNLISGFIRYLRSAL
jgi:four helix bundle protein